jgi:hypothetical protein
MTRRITTLFALVGALAVLAASVAVAANRLDDDGVVDSGADVHGHNHGQHGGGDGHLPPSSSNVRLVGKMRINQDFPGRVSDVGVLGNYAYLGAFNERDCQKGGVYVFDIANPAAPKQVNFIRAANDSYVGEGVQALHVDTPAYRGDLLVYNNEICGPSKHAQGGVSLVDVSNPKVHRYLAEGIGDTTAGTRAHSIHSAFAWDAGDKAYVVTVDNEERADVDILDITNPRAPVLIAEYDLNAQFPQIVQDDLGAGSSFLHDMVVKQIGERFVMLLSYWDGGYVQLDVTDPTAATYLADTDFTNPDPELLEPTGDTRRPEGNGHQAEFSRNDDFIVAADEDFSPEALDATNVDDGTTFATTTGSDTPEIPVGTTVTGASVFVGRACNGDPAVPAGDGTTIAVVERGLCTFTEKVANVEAAGGHVAVVVFNREGSDGCSSLLNMLVAGGIPALFVGRDVGFALFDAAYDEDACRAGGGTAQAPIALGAVGDTVRLDSYFDGWGYVHLYRNGSGKLTELDTYAIPQAHDPAFSRGFGDLSIHEVAMSQRDNGLAYFAYYSGGFRVARIQNDELVETGHFIDAEGNNFWGVEVWERAGKEFVLASDRDYGVYIFEYTGP